MMAALMARHDIAVMPSNSQYWHETFGIVSIEAQQVTCVRLPDPPTSPRICAAWYDPFREYGRPKSGSA